MSVEVLGMPKKLLTIYASCINIPYSVGPGAWRECLLGAMSHGTVVGVNESFTRQQRATFREVGNVHNWGAYGLSDSPNPILWDGRFWRFKRGRMFRLHKAAKGSQARKYPGFNAARHGTLAVLQNVSSGHRVAFINTHLVPRGPKVSKAWRAWALGRSYVRLSAIVARNVLAGRTVVLMGDMNQGGKPKVLGIRWIQWKTVDKAGVRLPVRAKLIEHSSGTFPAPTDHRHGCFIDLTIRFKKGGK